MGKPTHFLIICAPFFGHARPTITFAMNLLNEHPDLYITYLCSGTASKYFTPNFEREMTLYNLKEEPRSRLNIKLLGEGAMDESIDQLISLLTLMPEYLSSLICNPNAATSTNIFERIPNLITIEPCTFNVSQMLDAIIPASPYPSLKIPILAFFPTNAALVNLYWIRREEYPETYWPPIFARAEKELASGIHGDISLNHVAYKIWSEPRDIIVHTPSLPPMFNHELNPQTDSLPSGPTSFAVGQSQLCRTMSELFPKMAGFIFHTSPLMEPGEAEYMAKVSPDQLFLHIGPQYPREWWDDGIPSQVQILSDEDQQTMNFLDKMESQYGPNSVLYISFGTVFIPTERPQLFDALIKTILEAEPPLPFVFAGGKTNSILTAEAKAQIVNSGRGLLAGFVPQQAILKHKATGWYLCHGGSNSVSESFLNGVPMVLWPYTIDQPLICNQLSVRLQLAFELLQVRNGNSIGRMTHRGVKIEGTQEAVVNEMADVWKRMRSEEGDQMRERVHTFKKAMKEDYYNGQARKAMDAFTVFMQK